VFRHVAEIINIAMTSARQRPHDSTCSEPFTSRPPITHSVITNPKV
jgi:hypothetical protein